MRWDDRFDAVFDDLEQQAESLALAARDAEVAELSRAEYARVDLAGRLHASRGVVLSVAVRGVGALEGRLVRTGQGWCLLDVAGQDWLVPLAAVQWLRGLSPRGVEEPSRPLTTRLGLASALRAVADAHGPVVLHDASGPVARGFLERVGADFVDVRTGDGPVPAGARLTVPLATLGAVRSV